MPSLLLVSPDYRACVEVEQIAARNKFRWRTVSASAAAKEWLAMEVFDVLLVDAFYGDDVPVELISLGWKHNNVMLGGIFSLTSRVNNEWYARLLGIRVCWGERALDSIEKTLSSFPHEPRDPKDYAILLVEDLDSPRNIISAYIESLGYGRVESVSSVRFAMETLTAARNQFFCVITDLNMPGESGLVLIEKIRREEDLAYLPIVVLTSYATESVLIDCLKAGATGFLVKPPRKAALRREIEKAKRIVFTRQSPRLCRPDDAHLLEDALLRLTDR